MQPAAERNQGLNILQISLSMDLYSFGKTVKAYLYSLLYILQWVNT